MLYAIIKTCHNVIKCILQCLVCVFNFPKFITSIKRPVIKSIKLFYDICIYIYHRNNSLNFNMYVSEKILL